jgi:FMN-dependent NADH-azoreductase
MSAYIQRNYMKKSLSDAQSKSLAQQDKLVSRIKAADIVVMAYPMHNFSMPGQVKLFFDAVMLNGETFAMGQKLMAGKKSLTLFTSGGIYPQDQVSLDYPNWDNLTLTAKINFNFMGFDESVVLGTSLRDKAESRLSEIEDKIGDLIKRWY